MRTKNYLLLFLAMLAMGAFLQAQVPNYVPTNGLVGWWPFNGNANDESGTGNNGTVTGATLTSDRFGVTNKAYSFNGSNSNYITVPDHNSLSFTNKQFSFSLWVNATPTGSEALSFLSKGYLGNYEYLLRKEQSNNNFGTYYWNLNGTCGPYGSPSTGSSPTLNLNMWENYTITADGSIFKIFKNGVLYLTFTNAPSCSMGNGSNNLLFGRYLGNGSPGAESSMNGKLDDIGIWNRALTQEEVTALYNTSNPCVTTSSTIEAEITFGQTYPFNGQNLDSAGTYTAMFTNAAGCDSVVTLVLDVIPVEEPLNCEILANHNQVCSGKEVVLSVNAPNSTNTQQPIGSALHSGHISANRSQNDSAISIYSWSYGLPGMMVFGDSTQQASVIEARIKLTWGGFWNVGVAMGVNRTVLQDASAPFNGPGCYYLALNASIGSLTLFNGTANTPAGYWYEGGWEGVANVQLPNHDWNATHKIRLVAKDGGLLQGYLNDQLMLTYQIPTGQTPIGRFALVASNAQYDFYDVNAQSSSGGVLWSTGSTASSITVAPSETTTYSVTVTQGNQSCTSQRTINVKQSSSVSQTISACNSYTWHDTTYTQSGSYTWTGTNAAGCDSVVVLNLNISAQPEQPQVACYQTATFNDSTCSWDVTGTQPERPVTACYETATFNNVTCKWDVSGTQPEHPVTACYETATFNNVTCKWDVSGTQPERPVTACYETATFNTQTCEWDVTGTQPERPVTACYETATFNHETCKWDVSGTPNPAIVSAASACGSYRWAVNQESYTASGQYTFNHDCQGYVLNLTINQPSSETVNVSINEGETYYFNGQNLSSAGSYTATLQNAAGCDSVVTLILDVVTLPGGTCYANSVVEFTQGLRAGKTAVAPLRSNPQEALFMPEPVVNGVVNFVSLGFGGSITLAFEEPVANGSGADLHISDVTWGRNPCSSYPEQADVFASQDGINFVYLGRACQSANFDLGALSWAQYVRIIDASDPLSFGFDADGYDLNGISCLNGSATTLSDDNLIACSLREIVNYQPGTRKAGSAVLPDRIQANNALGMPQSNNTINFVALGFGGTLEAKFDFVVFNQPGNDIRVVETSFGNPTCNNYPEKAHVSVSLDGFSWTDLGEICQDAELDLGSVPYAQFIRIQDVSSKASYRFSGSADGFDLDAVVVLNNGCNMNSARLASLDNTETADEELLFSLYPNPVEDYTIIRFDGLDRDAAFQLELFDAAGRLVASNKIVITGGEYLFRVTDLAPGAYQLVLRSDTQRFSARLLK